MITMLLGGLWHGAAWTFVVWGALHGVYLCINHAWNNYGPERSRRALRPPANVAGLILTFLAVVVAWVFFRADSMSIALYVLSKMADPTQHRASAAPKSPMRRSSSSMPRSPGSRRTRRRSWVTITRTGRRRKSRRVAAAPGVALRQPRPCWRSGFSESSSTANSSISGSDEHMTVAQKSAAVSVRAAAAIVLIGGGAEFRRRSPATVPARAAVSRRCIRRTPHAGRRADPEPAVRHRLHGDLARDPFPAKRHRPASGRAAR